MIFEFVVSVRGDKLEQSIFVFKNDNEFFKWVDEVYKSEDKYKKSSLYVRKMEDLKIGDDCYVGGCGESCFKVKAIEKCGENQYQVKFENGAVATPMNCYKTFKVPDLPSSFLNKVRNFGFNKMNIQQNYAILSND